MAPTDAQLALQNPQPQPLRVTQVSPPGTPLVSTHPAAQGHGASGSWAPPPPQETMNSVNADSQPGQMRRLQPGEEARPGAGSLGGLDELAGKVENLTTPIENYTEAGREEHPFLSRVGDITRGAKELLVGHQTPMGAQSGIGTNAVTALILPEDIALMRGEEGMAAEGASAEKKAVDLAQKALPVVKKGANAVVDALAHPTHGVVPIEGNPEFGGLRVRKVLGPTEAKVPAHQNPVLQRLSEKYGETEDASGVTNGASFLTKEGKFIHMPPGATHDEAVRLADIEKQYQPEEGKTDPRPQFIKDTDAVRIRTRGTKAGKEISISVPENGVTPEQVEGLKAATHAQVGQRGSVVMEVATPGGKTAENDFANANDVEPMLKQIGAHPESTPPGADRYDLGDVSEKNLSNEILQAHTENGGSTFNPAKGNLNGTDNYAVAAFPQRNEVISGELTPEHVQQFIDKNQDLLADPKNSIGTWVDESGKHSLDIVHTIPDRDAAVKMGEENNQKAIFDLKNMTEIPTGGTGEAPEDTSFNFGANVKEPEPIPASSNAQFPNYPDVDRANKEAGLPLSNIPKFENTPQWIYDRLNDDAKAYLADNPKLQKKVVDFIHSEPITTEEAANAAATSEKLNGWWRRFNDIFNRIGDSGETKTTKNGVPVADALKAWHSALSGNKMVEDANNLSFGSFYDWMKAGQPTDRPSIDAIIRNNGSSYEGKLGPTGLPKKGNAAMSDTLNKKGKVLHENLDTTELWRLVNSPEMKGEKPFHGNIWSETSPIEASGAASRKLPSMAATTAGGNLSNAVIDAIMGRFFGRVKPNLMPATEAKYLADTVFLRGVGDHLGIPTGEAQEQIWGTTQAFLGYLKKGLTPAEATAKILEEGTYHAGKDYADILLKDPEVSGKGGYLDKLKSEFGIGPGSDGIAELHGQVRAAEPPKASAHGPIDATNLTKTGERIHGTLSEKVKARGANKPENEGTFARLIREGMEKKTQGPKLGVGEGTKGLGKKLGKKPGKKSGL